MERNLVDLHTHSTASDGTDSPAELVRKADKLGLAALALTDHDTLAGLDEAEKAAKGMEMELVRGCEISSRSPYGEIHILGLWLPSEPDRLAPLEQALASIRALRATRNRRIAEKLAALGLPVTYEAVAELASEENGVIGRPHFAELLCRLKVVSSRKEAFERYLGAGGAAYVPRDLMEPAEAVRLMAQTGAVVALAHPGLIRCPVEVLDDLVQDLIPAGLTAVESYHSQHSQADTRVCVELAARHGLLLSGGSDYHGLNKPGIELGRGKGGLRVVRRVWENLRSSIRAFQ